jgi:hypothetical protein
MVIRKSKRGVPKGTVQNPTGKNQHDNIRAEKPIAVRLLKERDEDIRALAVAENKSLTQVMDEAIDLYLTFVQHRGRLKNPSTIEVSEVL